jgi:hypothetical protein
MGVDTAYRISRQAHAMAEQELGGLTVGFARGRLDRRSTGAWRLSLSQMSSRLARGAETSDSVA